MDSRKRMKQPQKKSGRGGPRPGAGRKPSGRRQIVLRVKGEIIDRLEPGATRKMRDIIERKFKSP
jgi:hypothetical protein